MDSSSNFNLQHFFPYHVRVLYRAVSESVASIYTSMFGLSVSEWRTMAVLGTDDALSASQIVERSSMDKVIVSRAIKSMRAAGLLKRDIDGDDRRKVVLRLTDKGEQTFNTLAPQVLELEKKLLDGLTDNERDTLLQLMTKVRKNAEKLAAAETPEILA